MFITAYMSDPEELHVATVDPPIGSGTSDHRKLSNRDADNQHPISAIEGLQTELDSKLETLELNAAIDQALTEAKKSGAFKGEKGEPGKTPVVGEDYFTDKDKAEIAKQAAGMVEIPPVDLTGYAKTEDIPKKPEDIGAQPAGNYATVDQLPSVPVQSVNGKTGAVSLSAADVKARPDNWMPTAQEVGALPDTYTPPNQTAEQVGADPKGTADTAVSQHNTAENSHNDIRLALKAINDRLTAFFDSDDATLDELSEIVAYITSNKTLIEAITTSKVSVSDIVNNLTTNVANKPLSAAQGVVLKGLIDAVRNSLSGYALKSAIPTKASQLTNDAGYLTQHQDISGKVDVSKPVDPNWDKWNDIRYSYGFDKTKQPIFNTVNGTLESDTMLSVRGGKGRWGWHNFEGWSPNELSRLTMLMGKLHETFACIQTFSPNGLYESRNRWGWVKLGSDELKEGTDFSKNWATCYTPLTLAPQAAPSYLADYDLNPQFASNTVPVGTMYFDEEEQRIKLYTKTGWQTVAFVGEGGSGGGSEEEFYEPIVSYRNGYYVEVETSKIVAAGSNGRIAAFRLNKNTKYTVTRSALSARFRIYLYHNTSLDDAIEKGAVGTLIASDTSNTSLSSLSFTNTDFAMAVVMLSNKADTTTTITATIDE